MELTLTEQTVLNRVIDLRLTLKTVKQTNQIKLLDEFYHSDYYKEISGGYDEEYIPELSKSFGLTLSNILNGADLGCKTWDEGLIEYCKAYGTDALARLSCV